LRILDNDNDDQKDDDNTGIEISALGATTRRVSAASRFHEGLAA